MSNFEVEMRVRIARFGKLGVVRVYMVRVRAVREEAPTFGDNDGGNDRTWQQSSLEFRMLLREDATKHEF